MEGEGEAVALLLLQALGAEAAEGVVDRACCLSLDVGELCRVLLSMCYLDGIGDDFVLRHVSCIVDDSRGQSNKSRIWEDGC